MITQAELKTILHYDPETGVFTRLQQNGKRFKIGEQAGCIARGYVVIRVKDTLYRAHRLAWIYMHEHCPKFIDHIDGIKDNNRIANLRPTNKAGNAYNAGKPANNSSGIKGVSWLKANRKWRAKAKIRGKHVHIGLFETREEAAVAYYQFISVHHGAYARLD